MILPPTNAHGKLANINMLSDARWVLYRGYSNALNLQFFAFCNFLDFSALISFNPLSANPTKWSNTFKQFVNKLPTNCLSVFDHFVGLALKWLNTIPLNLQCFWKNSTPLLIITLALFIANYTFQKKSLLK